jgi:hypothetical protein
VKRARVAVVSVDSNVESFDSSFRRDAGADSMEPVLRIEQPPIKTTIYTR